MPHNTAETPEGLLLVVNGIDDPLRWDGLASSMGPVGMIPPATAPTLAAEGLGNIVGLYYAYVRFVDVDGNFSNLSPIATGVVFAGSLRVVTEVTKGGDISATGAIGTSPGHGLTDGAVIQYFRLATIPPATTMQIVPPLFAVSVVVRVIDADNFEVMGPAATGSDTLEFSGGYTLPPGSRVLQPNLVPSAATVQSGSALLQTSSRTVVGVDGSSRSYLTLTTSQGTFTNPKAIFSAGSALRYTNIPIPVEQRVVRRQILRNTAGQTNTFYVDVDTTDLTSTTFTSTLSDSDLSAQTPVALLDSDGLALANQYTTPPTNKAAIAAHIGRMFMAVEKEYREGCVSVSYGSPTVQGIGTQWPGSQHSGRSSPFALRYLWVDGAPKPYQISSVDAENQTLTLSENYKGATDAYQTYAVRPAIGERRLVYYSQAGLPEAWPATNAFEIQEDSDEITGLLTKGSFLYITERKHIYRFTYQDDPAKDGFVFMSTSRGCVNQKSAVVVEEIAYMLDEGGVHAFEGGTDSEPLSLAIQDLFEPDDSSPHAVRINWEAQQFFHCVYNPTQETIRWFVALSGSYLPRHALVYQCRTKQWWIEEFPFAIGASAMGRLNGKPQLFLGGPGGKVFAFGHGYLDGPLGRGTLRSTATAATLLTLTDTTAVYAADGLVGAAVSIVGGAGKGQWRLITAVNGTTLTVDRPWLTMPGSDSVYQIGGVRWAFRTGWFRWAESEEENPRRLEIVFEPTDADCTLDARLYLDRSEVPMTWESTYTSESQAQFSSEEGSADLVADLTKELGFVQRRFGSQREYYVDGKRFVRVEFKGVSNDDLVRIFSMALDGATQ